MNDGGSRLSYNWMSLAVQEIPGLAFAVETAVRALVELKERKKTLSIHRTGHWMTDLDIRWADIKRRMSLSQTASRKERQTRGRYHVVIR